MLSFMEQVTLVRDEKIDGAYDIVKLEEVPLKSAGGKHVHTVKVLSFL